MSATIAPVRTNDECVAAATLLARIWGTSLPSAPLSSDLIRSLVHAGGCALAATVDEEVVGVAVGVFGAPESRSLYSLLAAVDGEHASRGLGRALKVAQRQWALERNARSMTWTFDPLIRRNAHFNLTSLGADVVEFLESFYPPMHDLLNRGDEPDRLTVRWDLSHGEPRSGVCPAGAEVLASGPDERPRRAALPQGPGTLLAQVPHDIERMRRERPEAAAEWRGAIREVLHETRSLGYRITGFTRSGHYVLEPVTR